VIPPVAALAAFIAGQILIEPRLYSITNADGLPPLPPATMAARTISLLGGRVRLDMREYPLLGPADSPYVLADLLDYTCPNCRHMHRVLEQVRQRYPQLAVVLVPVPLDRKCNANVPASEPEHTNACVYARYALAVWLADPGRFAEYHEWLFSGDKPPPIDEARRRGEAMLGRERFAGALGNPAIERTLRAGVAVDRPLGGTVPKLLLPSAAISGRVETAGELMGILEKRMGLSGGAGR
jgi:hypothetical protein